MTRWQKVEVVVIAGLMLLGWAVTIWGWIT